MDSFKDSLTGGEGASRMMAHTIEQEIRARSFGVYHAEQGQKLHEAGQLGEMVQVAAKLAQDAGQDGADRQRGQAFYNGAALALPVLEQITGLAPGDIENELLTFDVPESLTKIDDQEERLHKIAGAICEKSYDAYVEQAEAFHDLVEKYEINLADNDGVYVLFVRRGFGFVVNLATRIKRELDQRAMQAELETLDIDAELDAFFG